jgi:hypothetical protein
MQPQVACCIAVSPQTACGAIETVAGTAMICLYLGYLDFMMTVITIVCIVHTASILLLSTEAFHHA